MLDLATRSLKEVNLIKFGITSAFKLLSYTACMSRILVLEQSSSHKLWASAGSSMVEVGQGDERTAGYIDHDCIVYCTSDSLRVLDTSFKCIAELDLQSNASLNKSMKKTQQAS